MLEDDPGVGGVAAITRVVPYLGPELQKEVIERTLQTARSMRNRHLRAHSLAALIPVLPRPLRRQTVDELLHLAEGMKNEYERAEFLSSLVPCLASRQTRRVLLVIPKMRDESARVEILAMIAPGLPHSLIPHLIAAAATITDEDDRSRILCALGQHLDDRDTSSIFAQATACARRWSDSEPRAEALGCLVPAWLRWVKANRSGAQQLFTLQLHQMAAQSRYDLLSDLGVFVPVIAAFGGTEAAAETARAILDVGVWWP